MTNAFDPADTYAVISSTSASTVPGGDAFWSMVMRGETPPGAEGMFGGWLFGAFASGGTWDMWEMHPHGDEIVMCLSGEIELVLERGAIQESVLVGPGRAVVVPRGAWHTAIVHHPGHMLHVTCGEGTEHRPVADHPVRFGAGDPRAAATPASQPGARPR